MFLQVKGKPLLQLNQYINIPSRSLLNCIPNTKINRKGDGKYIYLK